MPSTPTAHVVVPPNPPPTPISPFAATEWQTSAHRRILAASASIEILVSPMSPALAKRSVLMVTAFWGYVRWSQGHPGYGPAMVALATTKVLVECLGMFASGRRPSD